MIDQLKFIDELNEIKTSLGPNVDNKTMNLIDKKIAVYQLEVEEFEKWADAEAQKDAYLEGTDIHDSSDSPFLAHPGDIPGEKSEWNQQFYRGLTNKTFSCIVWQTIEKGIILWVLDTTKTTYIKSFKLQ